MPTSDAFLPEFIQSTFFSGYTVFNTLVYGVILIFFLYIIWKLFNKLEINPISLIYSVIPFILLGSSTRALVDNYILPKTVFLITPGIYFLVGFVCVISFIISYYLNKTNEKLDYRYILFLIGLIVSIIPLSFINHLNFTPLVYILVLWLFLTFLIFLTRRFWSLYKDNVNFSIISAHLFDASSTFIAVNFFGYYEQHVLPNFIYTSFNNPVTILPLKFIIISFVLILIDKYVDDSKLNGLLKLCVFILGLAPGLRNFITLSIGII